MIYKNINFTITLSILLTFKVLVFFSCRNDQIKNKKDFIEKFDHYFDKICSGNNNRENNNWEYLDRKFRILIKEIEPRFRDKFNEDEKINIWIKSLVYLHQRFGIQLLKRYSETDDLILTVKRKILENKIVLKKSLKEIISECGYITDKYDSKTVSELESIIYEER